MALFGTKKTESESPDTRPDATGSAQPRPGERELSRHDDRRSQNDPTRKGEPLATIGKSIHLKGELSGEEDLEVEGTIEGDIKLPNHVLKIGAHGKVMASVLAQCVQVIGRVSGDVNATDRVEVEASGVVEGDIRAPRLLVQEGAVINGRIEMTEAKPKSNHQDTPAAQPALKVS